MDRSTAIAPWLNSLNDKLCHFPVYTECDDKRTGTHRHRQLGVELNLTRQGRADLEVDGLHHPLQAGTLVVIPQQASHQLIGQGRRVYVRSVLCIAPRKEGGLLEQAMLALMNESTLARPGSLQLSATEMNTLHDLWRRIAWESHLQGPWWRESALTLAMESLISVARWLRAGRTQTPAEHDAAQRPGNASHLAQQVTAYIHSHIADDLTTTKLAQRFHISREHLSRIISREHGVPLHRFVMAQRIALAKRMLAQQPDEPLLAIALEAGFQSHAHFSRVFRQMEGIAPGAYRDMVAGA